MKNKMRKMMAMLSAAVVAVGVMGCGGNAATDSNADANTTSQAADATTDTTASADLSGKITLAGSTSMEKLANAMAEAFMEKYPNVTVAPEFTGSGAGLESLAKGTVDIGDASRALSDDEKAGGADEQIVVIGREAGSGTRDAFEELNDVKDACKYAQELDSTGAVLAKVAATPGAIGYVSLDVVDDTVKALQLNSVDATEDNILAGTYVLQRPFVMATMGEISEQNDLVKAFFDFIHSEEGQQVITSVGLIIPQ